ncbi:MAG: hypothetical protein PVS2B2_21280 [Candidatus Acidiferrum sp.]
MRWNVFAGTHPPAKCRRSDERVLAHGKGKYAQLRLLHLMNEKEVDLNVGEDKFACLIVACWLGVRELLCRKDLEMPQKK